MAFDLETLKSFDWRSHLARGAKRALELSESPAAFGVIALALATSVYVFSDSKPDYYQPPQSHISDEVADIETENTASENIASTPAPPTEITKTYKIKRGETLITLLKRAGIRNSNAHAAVNALDELANLRKINIGDSVEVTTSSDALNEIAKVSLRDGFDSMVTATRRGKAYASAREAIPTITLTDYIDGTINDSLYLSAKAKGMSDKVIIDLIRMLSFDVDFQREIREGDQFSVYYTRRYAPKYNEIEEGRILSASLELRKRSLEATYFEDENGKAEYFDAEGKSTRKALMKTPLDVAVITSSYGKRKHPVLGYNRMHKGVDFRAPTGTPIMAAGDGIIERSSRYGAYGNYVRIRHNGNYKTAYAHLSRYGRGIKKGKRVKQGQIIGYSGATGRVTAAHLHYEVMLGGKQVNPMTLKMPTGRTLNGDTLDNFKKSRNVLIAEIEQIRARDARLLAENAAATNQVASGGKR